MDSENVTFRQYRERTSSNSSDLTFESTILSIPNDSLPNSPGYCTLQKQIEMLTKSFTEATQEIDKLRTENLKLRTDLKKQAKIVDQYKNHGFCDSPLSINATRKRKRQIIMSNNRTGSQDKQNETCTALIHTTLKNPNIHTAHTIAVGNKEIEQNILEKEFLSESNKEREENIKSFERDNIIESDITTQHPLNTGKLGEDSLTNTQNLEDENTQDQVEHEHKHPHDSPLVSKESQYCGSPSVEPDTHSSSVEPEVNSASVATGDKEVMIDKLLLSKSKNGEHSNNGETMKVLILADDQGRNLRNMLQKQLGPKFCVVCFWKPGGKISDILESLTDEVSQYSKNDCIIILGGKNDTDPYEFDFTINLWLKSVKNTNVIISEVPYNRYLNEKKLNYVLRFTCNRFQNATFADMDYCQSRPNYKYFSLHVTRILLREILHIKYKNDKIKYNETYVKSILKKAREIRSFTDRSTQTNTVLPDENQENVENVSSERGNVENVEQNTLFRV